MLLGATVFLPGSKHLVVVLEKSYLVYKYDYYTQGCWVNRDVFAVPQTTVCSVSCDTS